ncbi:MAG: hypothetical protein Kow0077_24230 [Anaerolineae bacterium]
MSSDGRKRSSPNRIVFFVIIGLAVVLILCALVTQAVGWPRFCGGALILVGALLVLSSEEKGWPLVILLLGVGLFFWDVLIGLVQGGLAGL